MPSDRSDSTQASANDVRFDRLIVVGAGAVGGMIAACVHASGKPVTVVARGEHGRAIRRNGLELKTATQRLQVHIPCVETINELDVKPGDVALVATKLNDAEAVLDQLLAVGGRRLPVVCATNGVHGERWAARRFDTVVSMMVWTPASHLQPGQVVVYAKSCPAVLDCGCFVDARHGLAGSPRVMSLSHALCATLVAAGFSAEARPDMQRWKLAKWLLNLGNTSQALVEDDPRACTSAARAEGEAVLAATGIDHISLDALFKRCAVVETADVDGASRRGGSTWQSFTRGKPLESPWLEGAMADLGDELGVPAPVNRFLGDVGAHPRRLKAAEVLSGVV